MKRRGSLESVDGKRINNDNKWFDKNYNGTTEQR